MIGSGNMFVLKIRTEDSIYYVKKIEDNYCVICINNERNYSLNNEEWNRLLNDMFSGEKNFLERKDGYDIYIDSMNNKRFIKDGVEDLEKLLKVNGKPAILFQENSTNVSGETSKVLSLKGKRGYRYSLLFISFLLNMKIMSSPPFMVKLDENENKYRTISTREMDVEPITLDEMYKKINECKTYEEYQKDVLANKYFLEDVYSILDEKSKKELALYYDKLGIEYFSEQEKEDRPNTAGYVRSTEHGLIHLRDRDKEKFHDNGPHEFVHVNQQNMIYNYVDEAVAEIVQEEYFNISTRTYYEARKNISILMEIIGPEPIMRLSFNDEIENFEKIIKSYLDKEDANILLNEFKLEATKIEYKGSILKEANHELIREMLGKMYEKKYPGKKMEDDPIIQQYLNENTEFMYNRYYLNQHTEEFYISKEMILDTYSPFNNIENQLSKISYIEKDSLTKEEALECINNNTLKDEEKLTITFMEEDIKNTIVINKSNIENNTKIQGMNDVTVLDILNNPNIKIINIEKSNDINIKEPRENTIQSIFSENKSLQKINITFKDGSKAHVVRNKKENLYVQKKDLVYVKSIAEKFPSQTKPKKVITPITFNLDLEASIRREKINRQIDNILFDMNQSYSYIDKAYNEIVISEKDPNNFYNTEERKYLSILMEIIGPEPIEKYYYYKDYTVIENILNKYLNSVEAFILSNELKKDPEKTNPTVIENLLIKLYENMNQGKKVEDDNAITLLLNYPAKLYQERVYFNRDSPNYNKDLIITAQRNYDEHFEENLKEIISYKTTLLTDDELLNILENNSLNEDEKISVEYIDEKEDKNKIRAVDLDKEYLNFQYNENELFLEVISKGQIKIVSSKLWKPKNIKPENGIIKKLAEDEEFYTFHVFLKDGRDGWVYNNTLGELETTILDDYETPSLSQKFPEQFQETSKHFN